MLLQSEVKWSGGDESCIDRHSGIKFGIFGDIAPSPTPPLFPPLRPPLYTLALTFHPLSSTTTPPPHLAHFLSVPAMYSSELYPGAALIATGLSLHGYRKGSLSRGGAIAAWVVGYGHLANPLKLFGTTMIVFYLVGSRATKVRLILLCFDDLEFLQVSEKRGQLTGQVKAQVKATLEDGPDPSKPGGNRNAIQVSRVGRESPDIRGTSQFALDSQM
jgi:hypothetical protein